MFSNANLNFLLAEAEAAPTTTEHGAWFEYISDYALRTSPEYGGQISKIERYETWARRELPQALPSQWRDLGVDRVVTTHSGEFWAVQNKGYAAEAESSYSHYTNFIAQARSIPGVTKLLWITSGAGLNRTATDHNRSSGSQVVVHNRSWLAAGINYPATIAEVRAYLEEGKSLPADGPYQLRIHQEVAVANVLAGLDTNPAVQFISACGTGKTITAHALHEALGSKLTSFFAPTLGLLRQTIRAWTQQSAGRLTVIAVCSDEDMLATEDHLIANEQEFGRHLIRNPDELASTIASALQETTTDADGTGRPVPVVVFSTYHSSEILVNAQHQFGAPTYDLAVADEAHNLAGCGFRGELVKFKEDGKKRLIATKRVYTTATPKVTSSDMAARHEIDSLDENSPVFGPQAHVLTFGEAIQLAIISPYRMSIIVVPDELMAVINQNVSIDGMSSQYLSAAYAIDQSIKQGQRKFISYHSRVAQAKAFANFMGKRNPLGDSGVEQVGYSETVWGNLSAFKRESAIAAFKASDAPALLTNSRCLNEGIDIPELDTVVFADPKAQVVDIVQSASRVCDSLKWPRGDG
ncbi:hypothetical protein F1C58_16130 (plasmid) [Glaciihabitans sp. INWT7]|uniref:DEAD/DEAH box helicase family protein n=1 Tax=Glaciihabitans sp. INWT7 TaxID=2596912 RepID=UPI001627BE10|nr:DEAD/DEAH box helicase family protein [Glaciihabitans sp. INWT7]QNE48589.1 hypothetical protein F1C58_16130 [Glaciihabitans sp. INWT7]